MECNDNVYTIVGIDPGNNLGIGILHIDTVTNNIVAIESQTIVLDRYVDDGTYNVMLSRLVKLREVISGIHTYYNPLAIGLEAAFMNSRFPKSVIQLSQYVATIELSSRISNPWCRIFKYAPKYIKAAVGATGKADKDSMRENLYKIPEIANLIDLSLLSEHAVDSLSMAYVTYKELILNPHYMYTLPF